MNQTRRIIVSLIAILSLFFNMYFLIKIEKLQHKTKINNLILLDNNKFKFKKGIYLVYPIKGESCSSCIFSLCKELLGTFEKKINILLPKNAKISQKITKEFKHVGNFVVYNQINSLLQNKLLFVTDNGEIIFCIDIELLSGSAHKNLKSFVYYFKYLL